MGRWGKKCGTISRKKGDGECGQGCGISLAGQESAIRWEVAGLGRGGKKCGAICREKKVIGGVGKDVE